MKNIFKMIGIIAFVAVIGFTATACGDSGGGGGGGKGGTLTFSDELPPNEYEKPNVYVFANNTDTTQSGWKNNTNSIARHVGIDSGDVNKANKTIKLRVSPNNSKVGDRSASSGAATWKGNGTFAIYVEAIIDSSYNSGHYILKNVVFTNGSATVEWDDFTEE